MELGERIKFVRKLKNMTQLELAEKCGLGNDDNARTRISQYESGTRTPKEDVLERISQALGITSLYLSTKERTFADDLCMLLFDMDNDLGVDIVKKDDNYLLDIHYNHIFTSLYEDWIEKKKELAEGKITKEEYMMWKINYDYKNPEEKMKWYGYKHREEVAIKFNKKDADDCEISVKGIKKVSKNT